mmetsp:Transcript_9063/g.26688  ORF Transcript_9063/g.26688 Transcript_9063/m.26688 type:complete len:201 (-) Transcript_9063:390-992(-)
MPDDVVAPAVECHDLAEREHGPAHGLEVDLVVPAAGRAEVGVVEFIVVADSPGGDDGANLDEHDQEPADPGEGLERVEQAVGDEVELLEDLEQPHQADEPHEPDKAHERGDPCCATHANGDEHEGVDDRRHNDDEVEDVPGPEAHEGQARARPPLRDAGHCLARGLAQRAEEVQPVEVEPEAQLREEDEAEEHLQQVPER